ncbi:hypothetical protein PPACK8108_LOCUS9803 [Phakopsora pachyrhizi]|uniref:Uncharacterized protein n=1 Tax=Phakopsora pachyrhizi TaxID=170000 RepID=A0AAV0AZ16_PHAPC|nr:hypothetical protein PPACK8108_LOCUS9803 [Phakopsora pachyrhizi]
MLYTIEIYSTNYSGNKMITRVKFIFYLFYLWSGCEIIKGMYPYGAHPSRSNNILSVSRGKVPSNENHWKDIGMGNQASDPKVSITSENNLLKGTGWREGQYFTSILEPSINSNPVVNQYYNTEGLIRSSNQLIPNFSENDLFEGIGWDGEQFFASLLEPDITWNTVHSQNHGMLSSQHVDNSVPLEHSQSISALYSDRISDQPSSRDPIKFSRPSVKNSPKNSDYLAIVKKKTLRKQKKRLKLKNSNAAASQVINGNTQDILFQTTEKTIKRKIPKHKKFSNFWWHNVYLPVVMDSLTKGEDATLGLQIFFDRMDELADELISSYEGRFFWKKRNLKHKTLFAESATNEIQSDNFKTNFGEIIDQGDKPYHISLIGKFKEKIKMAGSTENLSQFLPLFSAMESRGEQNEFVYIDKAIFHSFFRSKNSRGEAASYSKKLKIPLLDDNFYQVLSNQINDIGLENFFKNDCRILKDRALSNYIKQKSLPDELKVYKGVLKGKLLMRNLYLTVTTLINKLFCEGRDDLNQNYSKRQKEAIEFYDLVWKSFRLANPDEFIIDTSALPSVDNARYSEVSGSLIKEIEKIIKADVVFKPDQNTLRYVWKFVDLWLIYYKAELFISTEDLSGQYRTLRNFVLSLPNFLIKLHKKQ